VDPLVRFGVFQLDLETGELWKSGVRIRLPEQPFQVLEALIERPGDLVTREELRQRLWPADTFVDFEHGLNAAVRRLRDALGDSAEVPRFVETIPRRGYRFIAPLAGPVVEVPTTPPNPVSDVVTTPALDARMLMPTLAAGLLLVVAVSAIAAGAFLAFDRPSRHSTSVEASTQYRLGRANLMMGTRDGVERALGFFTRATELDPTYALAFAGLADAYTFLGSDGFMPMQEAYPLAKKYAEQALERDPDLAEAHASLGSVMADFYRDWKRARFHFQKAVDLAPNYPQAHGYYSFFLACMRDFDLAVAEAQRAREIETASAFQWMNLGTVYYFKGDYHRALVALDEALNLSPPNFVHALVMKGRTYAAQGRHDEAIQMLEQARAIHGDRPDVITPYAYVLARAGRHDDARRMIEEIRRISDARPSPFRLAYVHTALGEHDRALSLLEEGAEGRDWQMQMLRVEPAFDGLRGDPRFDRLLARLGLFD
jgi:DNA-binding winged helix-turn-helix (wHTH) protein/tetratricopeptide (TPR) repeat protein